MLARIWRNLRSFWEWDSCPYLNFSKVCFALMLALGCVLIAMILVSSLLAAQGTYDDDDILDFYWTPATGNVDHYRVYASINDRAFFLAGRTPTPSISLRLDRPLQYGDKIVVMVQAFDAVGGSGDPSPVSLPVWRVRSLQPPPAPVAK